MCYVPAGAWRSRSIPWSSALQPSDQRYDRAVLPGLAESVAGTFALAETSKLQSLFNAACFVDFATDTVEHAFVHRRSTPITTPLNAAAARPVRRWSAFPRHTSCGTRRGAARSGVTPAGQSSRKPSTELPVESAKEREADRLTQPGGAAGSGRKPPVAARSSEGLLSDHTADAQPAQREQVFLPQFRPIPPMRCRSSTSPVGSQSDECDRAGRRVVRSSPG